MAIELRWDDQAKTIIREDYRGQWTWDNFFAMSAQANDMMKSVPHTVDIIANMKDGMMPMSGASMSFTKKVLEALPPNWGIMIIVTNAFIRVLASVFVQFDKRLGAKVLTADSLEHAYLLLEEVRSKRASEDDSFSA